MLLAWTECTLYLEKREDEREYPDFTREKKLFEFIQKICLEVVDDDFDTFNDEHNERGQNAQNKHDREDRKDDTPVVENVKSICILLFCFFVRVERVRFLLDLRLFLWSVTSVCGWKFKGKSVSLSFSLCNLRTSYLFS